MVDNVTLKVCVVDDRHADGEVLILVDVVQSRLRHVDALQELIATTASHQGALLVHAETTNTHAVVVFTWRQLKHQQQQSDLLIGQ